MPGVLPYFVSRGPVLIEVEGVKEFDCPIERGADQANITNIPDCSQFTFLLRLRTNSRGGLRRLPMGLLRLLLATARGSPGYRNDRLGFQEGDLQLFFDFIKAQLNSFLFKHSSE